MERGRQIRKKNIQIATGGRTRGKEKCEMCMERMNRRGIRWTDKNRRGKNAKGNEKEQGGSDVLANPNTGNDRKGETENTLRPCLSGRRCQPLGILE